MRFAAVAALAAAGLVGCGGGGGDAPPAATPYTVSGTVSGLAGTGLVLQNNGTDDLAVHADGTFAFSTPILSGAAYAVTVSVQPGNPGQSCTVTDGSGNIGSADITHVSIHCITPSIITPRFTVGGTVSGLAGTGLVLQNNGTDDLAVHADGTFAFSTPILSGAAYAVTVSAQPGNPGQSCTVSDGAGIIGSANVSNISVICTTHSFTVGGTVSGLAGAGLVLQNNGTDDLAVHADGTFAFSTPIPSGAAYAVTVSAQPTGPSQSCAVTGGAGIIGSANVSNISVICTTHSFTVGGTVSGLTGTGLVLRNNGANDLPISGNGAFTFTTPILSGAAYAVRVSTQPTSPSQTCTVTGGAGNIGSANITGISVNCVNNYTVGGTVSGLAGTGLVLRNNGRNSLAINSNGTFTFSAAIASGTTYAVTVFTAPTNPSQSCAVTNGSGRVNNANVSSVSVNCTTNSFTIGGTVSGLAGTGLVLQNNGADDLAISGSGTFIFTTPVLSGAAYAVTVSVPPINPAQLCAVTGGSGTVGAASVTQVNVSCGTDDPLFVHQWHLQNSGQAGGTAGEDVDVVPVWNATPGIKGTGVRIAIVDDGLEIAHEDLSPNVVAGQSHDYISGTSDPTPTDANANHGSAVGGVAAARDLNDLGGAGAAPRASLVGYNLLQDLTVANEADAMTRNAAAVFVSNNSWGAPDDGRWAASASTWRNAIDTGTATGRNGRGTVYTWAAGNGGTVPDNSNYDGQANYHGVLAICAVGDDGIRASYSERGANLWVCTPSEGRANHAITTTDRTGAAGYNDGTAPGDYANANYTNTFNGTSSAAPLAAGVIALVLEANPNLTWRDLRLVLAQSARQNHPTDTDWVVNGAGFHINHNYGFGVADADAAVALAQTWVNVGPELEFTTPTATVNASIPDNDTTGITDVIAVAGSGIGAIEFIDITFNGTHTYVGDLEISLTAPSGTTSQLSELHACAGGCLDVPGNTWRFGSARHLGEAADGAWTLRVRDLAARDVGTFASWQLTFHGRAN